MTLPERLASARTEELAAAFKAHTAGQTKFTRRMAIAIGDHFGMTPMQVVAHFERERLLRSGSVEWFRSNGGITKDHVAEARADRALADTGAIPDPSLEVQPK